MPSGTLSFCVARGTVRQMNHLPAPVPGHPRSLCAKMLLCAVGKCVGGKVSRLTLSVSAVALPPLPKGEALAKPETYPFSPEAPPLGELAKPQGFD